jgi:hypothetical protein
MARHPGGNGVRSAQAALVDRWLVMPGCDLDNGLVTQGSNVGTVRSRGVPERPRQGDATPAGPVSARERVGPLPIHYDQALVEHHWSVDCPELCWE